jgi:hypothetical protein
LFDVLERSDTYRPMFSLKYSTLSLQENYLSMTDKVVRIFKNDKTVNFGLSMVCFIFLFYLTFLVD